MFLLKFQTR